MRDAHQVSRKRNVFAFAAYSPGEEDGINYFRLQGALEGCWDPFAGWSVRP